MATLPTLTVTDAQATRILTAFGTALAYKIWLRDAIVNYVIWSEGQASSTTLKGEISIT